MNRAPLICCLALMGLAPLAGAWWKGFPAGFGDFPPLIHHLPTHAPFNPWIFGLFTGAALLGLVALLRPAWLGMGGGSGSPAERKPARFPWWGWAGLALNAAAWIVAWGTSDFLGPFGKHTFFPLWLGYILGVDGLVQKRSGRSLIARSPGVFLLLFPASALSWWYFEFLNRFVQNWWYVGIDDFGTGRYILHATLCFSTVLPAVFGTAELLATTRWFGSGFAGTRCIPIPARWAAIGCCLAGTLGLALLTGFPDPCFWLTWLAPLALLYGSLVLAGQPQPLGALDRADYRRLMTLAAAALICGFWWECWNFWSMPQWNYSLPYVERFRVFEMPVLGYAGYLPFGPICWGFWQLLAGLCGKSGDVLRV